MSTRLATHAGSWYTDDCKQLQAEIDQYMTNCKHIKPIPNARVLIGPHAGYYYSGARLAETFASWDNSKVKRVFILGPSHHVYFKGKALLSAFDTYRTPLGDLPVDQETCAKLIATGPFQYMDVEVDEDEHSFEMHMPFIYNSTIKLPQGVPKIIPILISGTSATLDDDISEALLPYLQHSENTFVISSDFCHWGSRFGYTAYIPTQGLFNSLVNISNYSKIGRPIYESIEELDKQAMKIASSGSYQSWKNYIAVTGNTICGQKAVAIVLKLLEKYQLAGSSKVGTFKWINYSQSSRVTRYSDSSVSYASGYLVV